MNIVVLAWLFSIFINPMLKPLINKVITHGQTLNSCYFLNKEIDFIMFTNYLPSEMVTVLEVTTMFSFLIGTILVMLFTSDQANKKNLYLKKAK